MFVLHTPVRRALSIISPTTRRMARGICLYAYVAQLCSLFLSFLEIESNMRLATWSATLHIPGKNNVQDL